MRFILSADSQRLVREMLERNDHFDEDDINDIMDYEFELHLSEDNIMSIIGPTSCGGEITNPAMMMSITGSFNLRG